MENASGFAKRMLSVVIALLFVTSMPLAAEKIEGILIDKMCCGKIVPNKGYDGAKMHTAKCALMPNCVESGLGVVTKEGKFLQLDAKGQGLAAEALKSTDKKDNLSVIVEGKLEAKTIAVESLKLT